MGLKKVRVRRRHRMKQLMMLLQRKAIGHTGDVIADGAVEILRFGLGLNIGGQNDGRTGVSLEQFGDEATRS